MRSPSQNAPSAAIRISSSCPCDKTLPSSVLWCFTTLLFASVAGGHVWYAIIIQKDKCPDRQYCYRCLSQVNNLCNRPFVRHCSKRRKRNDTCASNGASFS